MKRDEKLSDSKNTVSNGKKPNIYEYDGIIVEVEFKQEGKRLDKCIADYLTRLKIS